MEDLNESMKKVHCAEETIDYLINLWEQYRGVFDRFENAVASLYNKKEQNNKQIQTLIQTRDGLLPRLISGEVKL